MLKDVLSKGLSSEVMGRTKISDWKNWLVNFSLAIGAILSAHAAHYLEFEPLIIVGLSTIFSIVLLAWVIVTPIGNRKK